MPILGQQLTGGGRWVGTTVSAYKRKKMSTGFPFLDQLLWEIFGAISSLFNRHLRRQKLKPSTMGPEIIVVSWFRNNRGQKSADLVISEPRNNSTSNLSELRLFDFWILPRTMYHMSPLPIMYLVWYLSAVHVTHHPQQRITNTPTTAYRACCVRDRASSNATAAAARRSKPPQTHDTSTTAAA